MMLLKKKFFYLISIIFILSIIFYYLSSKIKLHPICRTLSIKDTITIISTFGVDGIAICFNLTKLKYRIKRILLNSPFEKTVRKLITVEKNAEIKVEVKLISDDLQKPPKKIIGLKNKMDDVKIKIIEDNFDYVNWHRSHGGNENSKYFDSDKLKPENYEKIKLSWIYHSIAKNQIEKKWIQNIELNPIVAEKLLITATVDGKLIALNALSGKVKWQIPFILLPSRRGITYWKDNKNNRGYIFMVSGNKLYKIDIQNGKLDKNFNNKGFVKSGKSLTAPAVYKKNIWVVTSTYPTLIQGFDLRTGKHKSTISSAGLDNKGAICWGGTALDPELGFIYLNMGNPKQPLYGGNRPGENFGSNSVVAVNLNTSKLEWVFQETKHDLWDYDIPSPPILTNIEINNQIFSVVISVTKVGNTIILDRSTGKPIFDVLYKRANLSNIPNEIIFPYQIDSPLPQRLIKLEYGIEDIADFPEGKNKTFLLEYLNKSKYGFFQPPSIGNPLIVYGLHGGALWAGGAVDPKTKTLFVPVNQIPWKLRMEIVANEDASKLLDRKPELIDIHNFYINNCSSCHKKTRNSTFVKKGEKEINYIPSLNGLSLYKKEKIEKKTYKTFRLKHNNIDINKTKFDEIRKLFKIWDLYLEEEELLSFYGNWSQFLDLNDKPATNLPWGKIVSLNLNTGLINWETPIGLQNPNLKNSKLGTPSYGGLAVSSGGLLFSTGTDDNRLYIINAKNGRILEAKEMIAAGSAPPVLYEIEGTSYISIVSTGGIFHNFKNKGSSIYTYKLEH
jgi:quinoprotein glucose dehydrogenase